jgi:branched-subunit amino acid aminotransferase/4-amino-4-deoxychorismate lyase
MSYILHGRLHHQDEPLLSIKNNGTFWFGDGFFESMKYANGLIYFAEQHWNRIISTCNLLGATNPFMNIDEFKIQVETLAATSPHLVQKIKLVCWRKTLGAYTPEHSTLEYLITTDSWEHANYPLNAEGLRLSLYTEHQKSTSALGNIKSTSSQLYVLATMYAKTNQTDDSILLNTRANLVETSRANLWFVNADAIYTPPLTEGCLNGVMRQVLLEICLQEGIQVIECPVSPDFLNTCQEVFISNSLRGVQWVQSVDHRKYPSSTTAQHLASLLNNLSSGETFKSIPVQLL